ncbi:MAG: diguanylate cyclase domain-containing protein [Pseudonocardiaceae bacterium]
MSGLEIVLNKTDARPGDDRGDLTELHLLREYLSHQSWHDALAGLPNQQFFLSRLEGVLGRAEQGSRITVCKIDLDGLAVINDGFGREIGDQLLQSVAQRLQSAVDGEKATVARFGSDEFAILIERSSMTPDVATLAASINFQLAEPVYAMGWPCPPASALWNTKMAVNQRSCSARRKLPCTASSAAASADGDRSTRTAMPSTASVAGWLLPCRAP